jgi:CopG family transcriptional regulator / antitoxin EndoAI
MTSTPPMQRVMITMPPGLLERIEESAARLSLSRSRLIRDAVELYLAEQRRQELRGLLTEGYRHHAERDLRICEEFAASDYEVSARQEPLPAGDARP